MKKRISHEVMIHDLKADPETFLGVYNGSKLVEIRLNDREFEVSDYVLLRQTEVSALLMKEKNRKLTYTGRTILLKIVHIQSGYGLKDGYVALSIRKLD